MRAFILTYSLLFALSASSSAFDDLIINQLLLDFLPMWVKAKMLRVQFKLHIHHGSSSPTFLHTPNNPVTILFRRVRIKRGVVFRQNLILIIQDDSNIGFVVEGARTA